MYERKIPELLDCGLIVTMKVIGGKWKAWIIKCINDGVRRPSAIHKVMFNVSPRIVNRHLRELEEYGIVYKETYAESPARVEYRLTEVGESVLPVIQVLETWGDKNKVYVNRHNVDYESGSCVHLPNLSN
jgi:DNA-binding HxlR family transcriptional regulator